MKLTPRGILPVAHADAFDSAVALNDVKQLCLVGGPANVYTFRTAIVACSRADTLIPRRDNKHAAYVTPTGKLAPHCTSSKL